MTTVQQVLDRLATVPGVVTDDEGPVTFADVARNIGHLADGLAARGVARGSVVGVWLPNERAWIETVLALGLLGARAAVLNPRYQAHELEHAVTATGMTHLVHRSAVEGIAHAEIVGTSPALSGLHRLVVGQQVDGAATPYDALLDQSGEPVATGAAADALWILFFTSGTTSAPKVVAHDQQGLLQHAWHCAERQGLVAGGRVLLTLPFCGVMGFVSLLEGLLAATELVTTARFRPDRVARMLAGERFEVWNCIDEMVRRVLDDPGSRGASLRTGAMANFGPDPSELLRTAFDRLGATLVQPYGMSEVQALAMLPPADAAFERRRRPGGEIVTPGTEFRIRDVQTREAVPDGTPGELFVRGPTLAQGYFGPGDTLRPLLDGDGWFATGDLAYAGPDGVTYLARASDALRLRGFLVEPAEIEDVIVGNPAIDAAQVVGVGQPTRAIAFVVSSARVDPEELRGWLSGRLADFKVPDRVVQLEAFPVTDGPHGKKVQRGVLRQLAADIVDED